ncbi:hypothetical protein [Streptomyces sp. ST2-7A]|uniref:hypothetical protein n=1 Tax=Streptomyces sp. ST2-7A TaxID=2907214 RepID=UPI001F2A73FF|nr:hypothetical protein [Streptomyces sp. ST2-7A]MCE7079806.1 hypothetical protein [Streptomyces sp. ST2-7A]
MSDPRPGASVAMAPVLRDPVRGLRRCAWCRELTQTAEAVDRSGEHEEPLYACERPGCGPHAGPPPAHLSRPPTETTVAVTRDTVRKHDVLLVGDRRWEVARVTRSLHGTRLDIATGERLWLVEGTELAALRRATPAGAGL